MSRTNLFGDQTFQLKDLKKQIKLNIFFYWIIFIFLVKMLVVCVCVCVCEIVCVDP